MSTGELAPRADACARRSTQRLTLLMSAGLLVLTLAAASYLWLDQPLAWQARQWKAAHPTWAWLITDLGHGNPIFLGGAIALALAVWRGWRRAAYFAALALAAPAVSGLLVNLLKVIFARHRPRGLFEHGAFGFSWFDVGHVVNGFPSGHASNALALATVLIIALPRWTPLWLAWAMAAALARVAVAAHYLSDVLVGGCLGAVVSLALHQCLKNRLPLWLPWFADPRPAEAQSRMDADEHG